MKILLFANSRIGNTRDEFWRLVRNSLNRIGYAKAHDIDIFYGNLGNFSEYTEIWFMNEMETAQPESYNLTKAALLANFRHKKVLLWDDTSSFAPSQAFMDKFELVAHVHDLDRMRNATGLRPKGDTLYLPYPTLGRSIGPDWPKRVESDGDYIWDLIYIGYDKPDRRETLARIMADVSLRTITVGGIQLELPNHENRLQSVDKSTLVNLLGHSRASIYISSRGQEGQVTCRLLESLEAGCPVLLGPNTGLDLGNEFPVVRNTTEARLALSKLSLQGQIKAIRGQFKNE